MRYSHIHTLSYKAVWPHRVMQLVLQWLCRPFTFIGLKHQLIEGLSQAVCGCDHHSEHSVLCDRASSRYTLPHKTSPSSSAAPSLTDNHGGRPVAAAVAPEAPADTHAHLTHQMHINNVVFVIYAHVWSMIRHPVGAAVSVEGRPAVCRGPLVVHLIE